MSEEFEDMAVHQLHLSYSAQQDRMLLKVNLDDTELNAWLTRRIVRVLWGLLQDSELSPATMPEMMAVTAEELVEHFAQSAIALPMMRQGAMMSGAYHDAKTTDAGPFVLITDCKLVNMDHTESMLELNSQAGEVYSLAMTAELSHALTTMLQLASQEASWDLGLATDRIVLANEAAPYVLH